ncbi:lactococcin 972 family bacteriocin [Actinomyces sp.]|uniref:lactococcin 972 family bacteriocin n=1 Tax=Actinomyces sp. TaxID=29317 RepID=UPI0026DDB7B3|nr:lactococcin 972 family bacteriocin [Actinomyces sp.]MDO4900626.1 lactococcin 972 family bacteriocin [Actinomyces sp.]
MHTPIRLSLTVGTLSAVLAFGMTATAEAAPHPSSSATAIAVTEGGGRAIPEGGADSDLITLVAATSRFVGGGTWNYNSFVDSGKKYCWSEYNHRTKRHSATAKMGNTTRKSTAAAGHRALASVTSKNTRLTCYVYWNTH